MKKFFRITNNIRWQIWAAIIFVPIIAAIFTMLTLNVVNDTSVFAKSVINNIELTKSIKAIVNSEIFNTESATKFLKKKQEEQIEIAKQNVKNNTTTSIVKDTTKAPTPVAQPRYDRLIIPKIGLNAQLVSVGLTSDGAVDVHPTLPAWFNQSSRAGLNNGAYPATFIDGHRHGIFSALGSLAVGDTVTVDLVSGGNYTYTVVKTELRSVDDPNLMRDALSIFGGASQGLNLMTCAGNYIPSRGTNELRLVIYTTR